jgi:hypothetical protein
MNIFMPNDLVGKKIVQNLNTLYFGKKKKHIIKIEIVYDKIQKANAKAPMLYHVIILQIQFK